MQVFEFLLAADIGLTKLVARMGGDAPNARDRKILVQTSVPNLN